MNRESNNAMPCSEFEALLAEAVDGLLDAPTMGRFEAHSTSCPHCGPLFTEALAGARWLKALDEAEPPQNLVRNILALTSHAEVAKTAEAKLGFAGRLRELFAPYVTPVWATVRQPRFAMSFAMVFFSFTMVMNLAGVRLSDLAHLDLRPTAVRTNAMRTYDQTVARVVKYYDNVRLVYEFQSRLRDIKNASEEQQAPQQQPKKDNKLKNDNTSGQPDQKEQNYSQQEHDSLMVSAPAGHRQFDGGSWPAERRMA